MRLRAVGTRGTALPNPEGPWATLPDACPTELHPLLTRAPPPQSSALPSASPQYYHLFGSPFTVRRGWFERIDASKTLRPRRWEQDYAN